MFKLFGRQYHDWEDFMATVNFFRFNPHSLPGIKGLLCRMGRHDFMPISAKDNHVVLECFYCEQKKGVTFDNRY